MTAVKGGSAACRKFSGACSWRANYGERYRAGERISTGFVESTVNQVVSKRFCKKQQMQWTKPAAHLLLQMRVKTLNHELASVFRRWYPNFPVQQDEARAA